MSQPTRHHRHLKPEPHYTYIFPTSKHYWAATKRFQIWRVQAVAGWDGRMRMAGTKCPDPFLPRNCPRLD